MVLYSRYHIKPAVPEKSKPVVIVSIPVPEPKVVEEESKQEIIEETKYSAVIEPDKTETVAIKKKLTNRK